MTPKQEFIKAIMQVLRLEMNIYTMGAIEEIIERLDQKDYVMFIAYLGERQSGYEKPIESIAKGVEEFYDMKMDPLFKAYDTKAREVSTMLYCYVAQHGYGNSIECDFMINKEFTKHDGSNIVFTNEDANIIKNIGGLRKFVIHDYTIDLDAIRESIKSYLLNGIVKPSITEKIKNNSEAIAAKTLSIIESSTKRIS